MNAAETKAWQIYHANKKLIESFAPLEKGELVAICKQQDRLYMVMHMRAEPAFRAALCGIHNAATAFNLLGHTLKRG